MRRMHASLLFVLFALSASGVHAAELEGFLPLQPKPAGKATGEVRLRGSHDVLLYAPQKGAELKLRVQAVQVGRYETEILAHGQWPGAPKLVLEPPRAGGPSEGVLILRAPGRGVVSVALNTSANAAIVTAPALHGWLMLEASARTPLHVISRCERLHFFVPKATRSFTAFGRGGGGRENCRLTVFAPDGSQAGQASGEGSRTVLVRVQVPEAQRGAVWSLKADKPPKLDGVLEDAYVWLSDDVPAYVSPQPDGLLVPFVHGLVQPPKWRQKDSPTPIELSLNIQPPAGARLHAVLGAYATIAAKASVSATEPARLQLAPSLPSVTYQLYVRLTDGAGKPIATASSDVVVTPSLVFVGHRQPLIRAELVARQDKLPLLSVARNVASLQPALRGAVRLVRTEPWETPGKVGAEVVFREQIAMLADAPAEFEPPAKLKDGHYQWQVVALSPRKQLVDVQHAHFLLKHGKLFAEVPPPPSGPLPAPQATEARPFPGFHAFVPEAAEAIAYNTRPTNEDTARLLRVALARGEFEPTTLGLLGVAELRDVKVSVSPLKHQKSGAVLPVDVRLARHWPQRTSWRTTSYRIIPEMLEPNAPFALEQGELKQVWLTVHAPSDAMPGSYAAEVTVEAAGRRWTKPLAARVRPFVLQRPTHAHWGLYTDSSRWRKYPDSQVRAELADERAHGITSLMVYPPYHSAITYTNGELKVDSGEFEKHLRMAKEAGFRPPYVMSMQALRSSVKQLTRKPITDPEFKKVYQGITRHFVELAKRLELGECVWHSIDEPWSEEAQTEAVVLLGYLKEMGLTTFTTAGPVSPAIDAALDVRCYGIGHLLGSEGLLQQQADVTRKAGDRLWYYGSGCYTGQDGNVRENRFVGGFLFWRSGAEGVWAWTLMRAKGNIYDDFDGQTRREHKEACIVYPSPDQAAPMPTLQWEGIREGVDDYCYAHTLQQLARRAGGAKGRAALARLAELMATVPVRRAAGDFRTVQMHRLREQLAAEIEKLVE